MENPTTIKPEQFVRRSARLSSKLESITLDPTERAKQYKVRKQIVQEQEEQPIASRTRLSSKGFERPQLKTKPKSNILFNGEIVGQKKVVRLISNVGHINNATINNVTNVSSSTTRSGRNFRPLSNINLRELQSKEPTEARVIYQTIVSETDSQAKQGVQQTFRRITNQLNLTRTSSTQPITRSTYQAQQLVAKNSKSLIAASTIYTTAAVIAAGTIGALSITSGAAGAYAGASVLYSTSKLFGLDQKLTKYLLNAGRDAKYVPQWTRNYFLPQQLRNHLETWNIPEDVYNFTVQDLMEQLITRAGNAKYFMTPTGPMLYIADRGQEYVTSRLIGNAITSTWNAIQHPIDVTNHTRDTIARTSEKTIGLLRKSTQALDDTMKNISTIVRRTKGDLQETIIELASQDQKFTTQETINDQVEEEVSTNITQTPPRIGRRVYKPMHVELKQQQNQEKIEKDTKTRQIAKEISTSQRITQSTAATAGAIASLLAAPDNAYVQMVALGVLKKSLGLDELINRFKPVLSKQAILGLRRLIDTTDPQIIVDAGNVQDNPWRANFFSMLIGEELISNEKINTLTVSQIQKELQTRQAKLPSKLPAKNNISAWKKLLKNHVEQKRQITIDVMTEALVGGLSDVALGHLAMRATQSYAQVISEGVTNVTVALAAGITSEEVWAFEQLKNDPAFALRYLSVNIDGKLEALNDLAGGVYVQAIGAINKLNEYLTINPEVAQELSVNVEEAAILAASADISITEVVPEVVLPQFELGTVTDTINEANLTRQAARAIIQSLRAERLVVAEAKAAEVIVNQQVHLQKTLDRFNIPLELRSQIRSVQDIQSVLDNTRVATDVSLSVQDIIRLRFGSVTVDQIIDPIVQVELAKIEVDTLITMTGRLAKNTIAESTTSWVPGLGILNKGISMINAGITATNYAKSVRNLLILAEEIQNPTGEFSSDKLWSTEQLSKLPEIGKETIMNMLDQVIPDQAKINPVTMLLDATLQKAYYGWTNTEFAAHVGDQLLGTEFIGPNFTEHDV